ncbi:nonstructural protein [Sigmofec virus UA08Rod_5645]|uniref:Nonstructural protein n=1 Tax=Sigmofec virus UA08Rod_5645 TaxID=2929433 RepID=A0A976N177_9VIRU|nr:nonstructural protein [Sigmofec virus UA08Rod_5645]
MIYNVYSIRDCKSGFMAPTFSVNDDVAKRGFSHAVVNSPDVLSTFVKDFDLFRVGQFDDVSGVLLSYPTPEHVISGPDAFRMLSGTKEGV